MIITVLAIVSILAMVAIALVGYTVIVKQGKAPEELKKERCSLCRQQFHKLQLIERQVGDYRLLYFCPSCINSLHHDLVSKN